MSTTSVMDGVVKRREDPALIQGKGTFVDDVKAVGMPYMTFNRSPYAHARITGIDTTAASPLGVKGIGEAGTIASTQTEAERS